MNTHLANNIADALTDTVVWLENNTLAYGVVMPLAMLLTLI